MQKAKNSQKNKQGGITIIALVITIALNAFAWS